MEDHDQGKSEQNNYTAEPISRSGETCAQLQSSKSKTKIERSLYATTAQQRLDQDQGKSIHNHMETLYNILGNSWNMTGT